MPRKKKNLVAESSPVKEPEVVQPEASVVEPQKPKVEGVLCKYCNRNHDKTFDNENVNHEKFDPGSKAAAMFENLVNQPRVPFFIPLEHGEQFNDLSGIDSFNLNGLRVNLKKGVMLEVPKQIAEVKSESMNKTSASTYGVTARNPLTGEVKNARLDLLSEKDRDRLNA